MQAVGMLISILWSPPPDLSETEAHAFLRAVRGDNPVRVVQMVKRNPDVLYARGEPDRRSVLHWAVFNGNPSILRCLLPYYDSPNLFDDDGLTPLHFAALYNQVAHMNLLLDHGADVDPVRRQNKSLFPETMRPSPLALAAMRGSTAGVRLLLARGADPNGLFPKWMPDTPLMMACEPIDNEIVLQMLQDAGADPNLKGATGSFPLERAVEELRPEAVKSLLRFKAGVNQKTISGNTVFSVLVGHNYSRFRGNESKRQAMMKIAAMLIKAGVNAGRLRHAG